jgi:hypothetical protein
MQFIQRLLERFGSAWAVLSTYPDLFVVAVVLSAVAAWWLRSAIGKGEVAALNARIGALEERLRLAADKFQSMSEERGRLEAEVRKLDTQIEDKMPVYALTQTSAAAVASLGKLDRLEKEVASSLDQTRVIRR